MERSEWLGRGIYSLHEAARLLGVDREKVARWSLGKTTARRHLDAALVSKVAELDERPTLTFADLVELLFIKGFRDKGLSLQYIRRAAERAATRYNTDHPFAVYRFRTDGQSIFRTELSPEEDARTHELVSGQYVIDQIVRRYMVQLDYDVATGFAQRWWPRGKTGRVFLDPRTNFGAPLTLAGLPTEILYRAYEGNGDDAKAVAAWYEVPVEDVEAAVVYEQQLLAA